MKSFIIIFATFCFSVITNASGPTNTLQPIDLKENTVYYINSNNVRVKSTFDQSSKSLGVLSLNDQVKIINPNIVYIGKLVEIIIVKTFDPIKSSDHYFISLDALSERFIDYKEFSGKYFAVVNIASETLRLYERECEDNSCPHKMIMETEVVVGEDVDHPKEEKGKGRSVLGSYRITGWSKFYQDPEGHYPSWYKEGYPMVPPPNASWRKWFSKEVMPLGENGKPQGAMRGAFGWYTAFVAPEPFGQWTHGTLGWGQDKDKYIKKVKKTLINIVSDPRSSGCTRNNNEAIAYLRKMLTVGAPIIKIYAIERNLNSKTFEELNENKTWNYILTKNRDHSIERDDVLKKLGLSESDLKNYKVLNQGNEELLLDPTNPLNQILEIGTYRIDSTPDPIDFTPSEKMNKFSRKLGRTGNVYGIKTKDMHGIFYVDAGFLKDYKHPTTVLEISGFEDEETPPWMNFEKTLTQQGNE